MQSDPSNRSKPMKNVPKKIYLQIDADGETPEEFNELNGITWCSDRINQNDIEYVLNPLPPSGEEETAVGFAEWLNLNYWLWYGPNEYYNRLDGKRKFANELYTLYLESKTQGK